jgi:hypothetical protein
MIFGYGNPLCLAKSHAEVPPRMAMDMAKMERKVCMIGCCPVLKKVSKNFRNSVQNFFSTHVRRTKNRHTFAHDFG